MFGEKIQTYHWFRKYLNFRAKNGQNCTLWIRQSSAQLFCSSIVKSYTEWPLITFLGRRIDKSLLSTWEIPEILRNIFVISTFLSAIPDCHSDQMCLLVVSTKAESRDTNYERKYETSDVVLKVLIPLGTMASSYQKIFYLESVKIVPSKNVQRITWKSPQKDQKRSRKCPETVRNRYKNTKTVSKRSKKLGIANVQK